MRIKIQISCENGFFVPFKRAYELSYLIRNILKSSDIDEPYFNFSPFRSMNREISDEGIILRNPIVLYITSPFEDYIKIIVDFFKKNKKITLFNTAITIEKTVIFPPLEISDETNKFKCLSPITVFKKYLSKEKEEKEVFLTPHDNEFYNIIRTNLIEKFKRIYGKSPQKTNLYIKFDKNYLMKKRKISKLVEVNGKKYKAWLSPFTMYGNKEIIQIAYEWGMGQLNSFGLGMIEIVR